MYPPTFIRRLIIRNSLVRGCLGECIGTFILVLLGDGVIAQVVLGGPKHGTFISISLGWGVAVMMGVFFSARLGKGLINPAVTLAFWMIGKLQTLPELVLFTFAQLLGAFIGAAGVFAVYRHHILEAATRDDDGELNATTTGGIFCTWPTVPNADAFLDQVVGTALLTSGALTIVEETNMGVPGWAHPPLIGLLVTCIVGCFSYNAGAALNPARDLGPRIFIAISGWGSEAFTARDFYFWVPIFGPYFGAVLGAFFFELLLGIHMKPPAAVGIDKRNEDSVPPAEEVPECYEML